MDSTGRIPLGGALGSALGYLLSQKRTGSDPQLIAQSLTPVASATAPSPQSPIDGAVPELRPAFADVRIPPAPPADWQPESLVPAPVALEPLGSEVIITREFLEEPLPGAGWHSSAPLAVEYEAAVGDVYEAPVIEIAPYGPEIEWLAARVDPVVETPVAGAPAAEEAAETTVVEEVVEAPMPEQRPADGTGASAVSASALARAAGVNEKPSTVESLAPDDISRVDDLKSRIEETRRRIRHELEQPFDLSAPAPKPLETDWTVAQAVPAGEMPVEPRPATVEPPVAQSAPVQASLTTDWPEKLAVPEALPVESVVIEALPVEMVMIESSTVESVAVEPLAFEPIAGTSPLAEQAAQPQVAQPLIIEEPVAAAPVVEVPAAAPVAPAPAPGFSFLAPMPPAPAVETAPVVRPVPVESPRVEPTLATPTVTAEPAALEQQVAQPLSQQTVEPLEALEIEVGIAGDDTEDGLGLQEPVDYDSMKNRIESTRSRLKAKAFDAMMTGEAALLGWDLDGSVKAPNRATGVDKDIDDTVETSLREEES